MSTVSSNQSDLNAEKFTFNQLFNSPLKRNILGLFFRFHKEFVLNTSWKVEIYDRLAFLSGKKQKLKKPQIEKFLSEDFGEESLQFLIDFKLLLPPEKSVSPESPPLSVLEFLNLGEEFSIITGIECAEDFLKTPSGGLKLSVGAIHYLLESFLKFKAAQPKVQSAILEMQTLPSRVNPGVMFNIFELAEEKTSSTPKKDIVYQMTDPVYSFLNSYHPLDSKVNDLLDGSIFLDLLDASYKVNKLSIGSSVIKTNAISYLKLLDSELVLKRYQALVDIIVLRELFIISYSNFFDDPNRIEKFKAVLDSLANDAKIGQTLLLDAERTANPLPHVFEFINPHDKPVGVVDDFLNCFSRLCIANVIGTILSLFYDTHMDIFRPKPGISIFKELYTWLLKPANKILFEHLSDLLTDAEYLTNYYSKDEVEEISKAYKDSNN